MNRNRNSVFAWVLVFAMMITLLPMSSLRVFALDAMAGDASEETGSEEQVFVGPTAFEEYEMSGYMDLIIAEAAEQIEELSPLSTKRISRLDEADRALLCESFSLPEELFLGAPSLQSAAHVVLSYRFFSSEGKTLTEILALLPDENALKNAILAKQQVIEQGKQETFEAEPTYKPYQKDQKYYGAPVTVDGKAAEQISLTDGSLRYTATDITLPGVNGLDLVIARAYDTSNAKYYGQNGYMTHNCADGTVSPIMVKHISIY